MKLTSANLLREGRRELRSLGDDCDDACLPAYCCANFELHGSCRGFKLLNGENRKKLNAMLTDDDVLYVESCMRMIQNGHNEDVLVPEVLRYLKRPEGHPRESGFLGMIEASRGVPTTPTPKQTEPELRSSSGFIRMLEESSKNASSERTQKEATDEVKYATTIETNHENIIPREGGIVTQLERVCARRTRDEPEPQTRLGFLRMLDTTYQQHVENGSVETHDRIPFGFGEMLEAAFPHGNSTTPDNKPRVVRRGLGFAAMLEGASKGT